MNISSWPLVKRVHPGCIFFTCLILVFLIYYPGTHGYFQFDDTVNILDNSDLKIQSLNIDNLKKIATSGNAGPLKRPISLISFAANYYFSGFSPYYFKLTNIFVHLINGICIYYLSYLLMLANNKKMAVTVNPLYLRWVSVTIATAWLAHPLNLTGVLYVVQRMTSLAALFSLLGLICYVKGRLNQQNGGKGWALIFASVMVFTPLSILSKETGVLLPAMLALTEWVFFHFSDPVKKTRYSIIALFSTVVLLPAILVGGYLYYHPEWIIGSYITRDFTLLERCLTETRVICFYIRQLVAPDISQFGLYHDDIAISHGLLDPTTTIYAVATISLLLVIGLASIRRYPVAAFGILFFLIGHSTESSFFGLEIAHEHRNYLPDFGLIFSLFYYLLYPLKHLQSLKLRCCLSVFLVIMFGAMTFNRATLWGDPAKLKLTEVERHPNSLIANLEVAQLYANIPPTSEENAKQLYTEAYNYYNAAAKLSPSDTNGLFGLIYINLKNSLPLEDEWIRELKNRLRNKAISASTGNSIKYLTTCYLDRSCKISPEVLEQLFDAILQNAKLSVGIKAQTLLMWSDFLIDLRRPDQEAAKAANLAAELNPSNIDVQIKAIDLLNNANHFSDALKRIEIARASDQLNTHSKTLDALQENANHKKKK